MTLHLTWWWLFWLVAAIWVGGSVGFVVAFLWVNAMTDDVPWWQEWLLILFWPLYFLGRFLIFVVTLGRV